MLVPVTISEIMNEPVETITPDISAREIAQLLHTEGIGSLVVLDDGEPVGIVTESDMVALLADGRNADELTAADCMADRIVTISTDESVERAVELFREHTVKKLPVVDDGELVGIVTTTDLSHYLPHLARDRTQPRDESIERHARERVDTAYENEDWEFESIGKRDDHIDLGDVVEFTKTISQADVEAFAEASGDTNRLHLDAEYAAGTRFGHQIVHGTLGIGVISAAIARLPGLIVYLSQDVSYLGPIPVGDRVTATCEVVEDLGNDRYRLTTAVEAEDSTQVIDGEAVVMADPIPETA
jgi:predicted transcriptional regulator/acyl dehydratase